MQRIGPEIRLEKEYRIDWLGGGYRHTFAPLAVMGGLRPYIGALAGTSGVGPLGKLRAGIDVTASEHLSLSLGLDGTVQMYRLGDDWLNTKKLNLVYGVCLHW